MNYWHMQLHPTGEKFQNEHLRRILIEKKCDWFRRVG